MSEKEEVIDTINLDQEDEFGEEEDEFDEEDSDDEEEDDFGDLLVKLMVSEEGQTVGESMAQLSKQMEMQNKLLVKLITQLKN